MPIFDQLKRGVDKTKFEADRVLRINKVQNEIGAVKREILGVREKIAEAVVQLHQQGPLAYPEVEDLCLKIDQFEAQIAEKETQIAAIRAEQLPIAVVAAGTAGVAATAFAGQPTAPCPNCRAAVPIDAAFCPNCGHKIPPRPKCTNCGYLLTAEAMFCPNCGQHVEKEKTVEASATSAPEPESATPLPDPNKCANCGFGLPDEATFCPECGTPHATAS